MSPTDEALRIMQEESAEVIQAISKIFRFGYNGKHPDSSQTNLEHLEEELGDLVCMLEILTDTKIISSQNVKKYADAKKQKLRKWSQIYEGQDTSSQGT